MSGFCVCNSDLNSAIPHDLPDELMRIYHAVTASLNWLYVIGGESEDGELLSQ